MKTISRYIMTLALLLTAATGAWAAITTEDIGKVICTDGSLYATKILAQNDGKTAAAMIGYVDTENNKALAIALTDGNNNMDWTQASEYCTGLNTSLPVPNGTWVLPTLEQWNSVLTLEEVVPGYEVYMSESLNTKLNAAKADALNNDGMTYWTCEETTAGGNYVKAISFNYGMASGSSAKKTATDGSMTRAFLEIELSGIEVTTNAASEGATFTEATFAMPAFDATVNYDIVRDMQDETNPVAFSGLPSSGNIVVKKGDDGKYQPIETLTIQLIDPLAPAEAQNIIAADGITIKVLVGAENGQGAIEYDQENPITLEAFLADMKPGYYWIKAVPTDETTSPYIGTVYCSEFTVVEKYDLTVKPANDFSKGKVESVTVGSGSVTIDANTGEATKTGIDPGTEVKVKAKRGYVIDKVEVKKAGPALKTLTVTGVATKSINYAEGDTWQQAIERPENAGSGWKVQGDYIFNGGLTLMIGSGYVRPGHTIDATKNYSLEAD